MWKKIKTFSETGVARQYVATGGLTLAMMTVGISVGWVSPALPKLLSRTDSPFNHAINHDQISWIASLHYFGMILSPLPTGWLMDRYGRKRTLLSLNCLAVASWVCIVWGGSTHLLYTARLLAGLWGGVAYTVTPVYIGEIADANIRGVLSTYMTLMKNFGNMFPYLIGPYISYTWLAVLCSLSSFLFFVISWLIPESPYYLLMRQRGDCAAKSLHWLRGKHSNVSVELKEIEFSVHQQMRNKIRFWDIAATKGNRRALFLVEAMAVLQRMCGIGPLKAFGSISLPDLGLFGPDQCMMLLSVVWLVFTSLAVCLIDRIGRRVLLIVSCLGSSMAMFLAGAWYYLDAETIVDVQDYSWVPLVCLIMHGALAHMGLEPIGTMLAGELFPANVRGYASSIASLTIAATAFVANKTYLGIADAAGVQWDYWFYAADCLLALAFVATFLIETKGKTLQQIQDTLNEEKTKQHDLSVSDDFTPVPQPPTEEELEKACMQQERELPPFNGIGTHEDSAINCRTVLPIAPVKSYKQFLALDKLGLDSHILRFSAQLITKVPSDSLRTFIISYFLSDDTINVFETCEENSGFNGGYMIARRPIMKPGQDIFTSRPPAMFTKNDFYVGNTLCLENFKLVLTGADEYALRYMELHSREVLMAGIVI